MIRTARELPARKKKGNYIRAHMIPRLQCLYYSASIIARKEAIIRSFRDPATDLRLISQCPALNRVRSYPDKQSKKEMQKNLVLAPQSQLLKLPSDKSTKICVQFDINISPLFHTTSLAPYQQRNKLRSLLSKAGQVNNCNWQISQRSGMHISRIP